MINKACKKRFQIKSPTHQHQLQGSELCRRTAIFRMDPKISFENGMQEGIFRLVAASPSSSLSS